MLKTPKFALILLKVSVYLMKPLLRAWLSQAFLAFKSCPQYHVVFFMLVCFDVWYWNKVWYDFDMILIWYDFDKGAYLASADNFSKSPLIWLCHRCESPIWLRPRRGPKNHPRKRVPPPPKKKKIFVKNTLIDWNNLPYSIIQIQDSETFKAAILEHLQQDLTFMSTCHLSYMYTLGSSLGRDV